MFHNLFCLEIHHQQCHHAIIKAQQNILYISDAKIRGKITRFDEISCALLDGAEGLGRLDEAEVRLPLGGVGDDVPGGGGDKLPLLGDDGQVVSNKT